MTVVFDFRKWYQGSHIFMIRDYNLLMPPTELDRLLAELRFMEVTLPDIYERVVIEDGSITRLNLDGVDLYHFPHFPVSIAKFSSLEWLSLRYNRLDVLPQELLHLTRLRHLDLGHNQLVSIPPLNHLSKLEVLRLNHNQLTSLPALPISIQYLHLGHNQFASSPSSLSSLPYLRYLSLANNRLMTSPDLLNFSSLRAINLRSNHLTDLPCLPITLDKMVVYDNPIDWSTLERPPSTRIIADARAGEGYRRLTKRIRDVRNSRDYPPQFGVSYQGVPFTSVMVYGREGVGKQSLVDAYIHHLLVPDTSLFVLQNRYLNWDHYLFRHRGRYFQFWYPYTQESYHPTYRTSVLNGFYYASCVILVFDTYAPDSFQVVLRAIHQIYEIRSDDCSIEVVGNKVDQGYHEDLSKEAILRTLERISEKLDLCLPYVECSVRTGYQVGTVFESLYPNVF